MLRRSWLSVKWLEAPLSAVMEKSTGCALMLIGGEAMKEQPIPTGGEDGREGVAKDVEVAAVVAAAVVDGACVTRTQASICGENNPFFGTNIYIAAIVILLEP